MKINKLKTLQKINISFPIKKEIKPYTYAQKKGSIFHFQQNQINKTNKEDNEKSSHQNNILSESYSYHRIIQKDNTRINDKNILLPNKSYITKKSPEKILNLKNSSNIINPIFVNRKRNIFHKQNNVTGNLSIDRCSILKNNSDLLDNQKNKENKKINIKNTVNTTLVEPNQHYYIQTDNSNKNSLNESSYISNMKQKYFSLNRNNNQKKLITYTSYNNLLDNHKNKNTIRYKLIENLKQRTPIQFKSAKTIDDENESLEKKKNDSSLSDESNDDNEKISKEEYSLLEKKLAKALEEKQKRKKMISDIREENTNLKNQFSKIKNQLDNYKNYEQQKKIYDDLFQENLRLRTELLQLQSIKPSIDIINYNKNKNENSKKNIGHLEKENYELLQRIERLENNFLTFASLKDIKDGTKIE